MKRMVSISLALSTLIAVCAIALFTLVRANVIFSNASASPVFISGSVTAATIDKNSFTTAQKSLEQKGITLSITPKITSGFSYTTVETTNSDLAIAAQMLEQEFSKYTTQTIAKTGLKRIYLVSSLAVGGQYRSGMPEPRFEDALYFDISNNYVSSENGDYMRRTFHHEFSHLIDYNLYGTYSPKTTTWESCNTADFRYGNGGASMYNDVTFAHEFHPEDGFITGYATSGIEEDRAETFAWFMTSPQAIEKLKSSDDNFSCKVDAVKNTFAQL